MTRVPSGGNLLRPASATLQRAPLVGVTTSGGNNSPDVVAASGADSSASAGAAGADTPVIVNPGEKECGNWCVGRFHRIFSLGAAGFLVPRSLPRSLRRPPHARSPRRLPRSPYPLHTPPLLHQRPRRAFCVLCDAHDALRPQLCALPVLRGCASCARGRRARCWRARHTRSAARGAGAGRPGALAAHVATRRVALRQRPRCRTRGRYAAAHCSTRGARGPPRRAARAQRRRRRGGGARVRPRE